MKHETVSTSAEVSTQGQRLPYISPSLKVYGQLRDLTDGGSGTVVELMSGGPNLMRMA
jgi:hypothetical protein